jgi:hypothetical protein
VDVLIWDKNAWYGSAVRLDWTPLGHAQLPVDFFGVSGGTGLSVSVWTRYLIRCVNSHCSEIWDGQTAASKMHTLPGTDSVRVISHLDVQDGCLVQETQGIGIRLPESEYLPALGAGGKPLVTTLPQMRDTYCWNGQRYTLSYQTCCR